VVVEVHAVVYPEWWDIEEIAAATTVAVGDGGAYRWWRRYRILIRLVP